MLRAPLSGQPPPGVYLCAMFYSFESVRYSEIQLGLYTIVITNIVWCSAPPSIGGARLSRARRSLS